MKRLLMLMLIGFSAVMCGKHDTEEFSLPALIMKSDVLESSAGSMFLTVDMEGPWTLSLDFGSVSPWAELGVTEGEGRRVDVDLYWSENTTEGNRTLSLRLVHENGVVRKNLTQRSKSSYDIPAGWMELPAVRPEGDQLFLYHNQQIANKEMRSWSYLWDPDHLVALWVAYPLNNTLIGSGSRTDEWGLDPKLPREKQPVLFDPFSGGYQRGHQLPSADRYNRAANIQTFYGTNMTPQNGGLNSGVWARLEGKVREWSYKFDTLYVVTGCTVAGSTRKAYDNDNKAVTVPTAYFKALLGYSRSGVQGITAQTGGYTGIAFYMKHFDYPQNYMDAAMTIDQLENITGFDFFVNLPDKISPTLANYVESAKDNYWYKE